MPPKQPSGGVVNEKEPISIERCRSCSSKYAFKLQSGETLTVLCGRPKQTYKAISYVWETAWPPPRVILKCSHCLTVTKIPMRDVEKLRSLLECMKGELPVWLDTMSINQDDESDKRTQLAVMGNIYRHAQTISVLLPMEDKEAYDGLKRLGIAAHAVVKRHKDLGMLRDDQFPSSLEDESLERLADQFLADLKRWAENVGLWTYWQRAWTFQEWATAREIEVRWEGSAKHEGLSNIKNVIVMATTVIVNWKKLQPKRHTALFTVESLFTQMQVRDDYGPYMHLVKAHFPFEDFLVGDDEDIPENLRRKTFSPGISTILRDDTFMVLQSRDNPDLRFRTLLSLSLNSMSMSKRIATKPADKVACWASMCNIPYNYSQEDSYSAALQKVVSVLRKRGLPIYIWQANTDSAEVDLNFLDYAAAQRQSNAASRPYYVGTPIFVGRVDTFTHVKNSLMYDSLVTHLEGSAGVTLRQVDRAIIKRPINWSDKSKALSAFRSMVSGKADGRQLFDVTDILEKEVDNIESEKLGKKLLVTVSIGVDDFNTMWYFNAWAICPANVPIEHLLVGRESLNGTLVLAVYTWEEPVKGDLAEGEMDQARNPVDTIVDKPVGVGSQPGKTRTKIGREPAKKAQIIAYLNTTHQRDGTYLMKVNEEGIVDVVFRTADTPQPELFWLPEGTGSELAGLDDLFPRLSECVSDMKISLLERKFTLAMAQKKVES
jgi:hypothetical protein